MSQDPRLTTGEVLLRRALKTASAPPFIAHAEIGERIQQGITEGLRQLVSGKSERISTALELFPAATSWLISSTLLQNYGLESHRIYDPISISFGVANIPNQVRPLLNKTFRRACAKLGLIVAGSDASGYVDDYILQAGAAKSQLRTLIEAFVRAETIIGQPPEEDTQRLNAWEVRAADFAPIGFNRLRNIMRWDESAFHAGVYARVRRGLPPQTHFESEVTDVLKRVLEDKKFERAAADEPLRLLFLDDALSLHAPAAIGVHVRFSGREKWIGAGRQLNLTAPWPEEIIWRRDGAANADVLNLMSDAIPIVLFDVETGAMLRALAIADSGKPIALNVTQVVIVARQPFRVGTEPSIDLGPKAHGLIIDVGKGIEFSVGQYPFILKPPVRPVIEMIAARVGRGKAGPLLTAPTSLRIRFTNGRPEGQLSVQMEHPALASPISHDVPLGDDIEVDLGSELGISGPAGPLRISVGFGLNGRTLVRASNWVWPGLKALDGGLRFDGPLPENLDFQQSTHIVKNAWGGVSLNVSEDYRAATLAFGLGDSRRCEIFEIVRPGTTIALVDEDGTERAIHPGTQLPIVAGSHSSLLIRSDDLEAALDIRGVVHANAFGRSGARRIGLASLVGPSVHSEIKLLPRGDMRQARMLIEVVSATTPQSFHFERDRRNGKLAIAADFGCIVDAAQLKVRDLLGSPDIIVEQALGRRPVERPAGSLLDGTIELETSSASRLHLHLADEDCWPAIAIGEMAVRIEGSDRWSPLRNPRGDSFPILMSEFLPSAAQAASQPGATDLFVRLADVLNRCHAQECWDVVQKVQHLWRELGGLLAESHAGRQAILRSWGQPLPLDVNSTWVPLRHPIEIAADMLGWEMSEFGTLGEAGEDFREFAQLDQLSTLSSAQDALTMMEVTPTFYTAFDNFVWAAQNPQARLLAFDMATFVKNVSEESSELAAFWTPSAHRLTQRHHDWCIGNFIDRFEMVSPAGQDLNGFRTQRLNQLINTVPRNDRRLALVAPAVLANRLTLVDALPAFVSAIAKAACWKTSDAHWNELAVRVGRSKGEVLEDIGFLLRLAPDLFAFYLLLWGLVWSTEQQ